MPFVWNPPPASNTHAQKWRGWIETVKGDVQGSYFRRDLFLGTVRIVAANPAIDGNTFWFGFFENTYVDSVVMAIRRQVKDNPDSISMGRLLREMAESPHLVTRSDFEALYREDFEVSGISQSGRDFAQFADDGSQFIDGARVRMDLESLRGLAAAVENYADRRVAHWDRREPTSPLTKGFIFDALDELGRLVKKYYILLAATCVELHPFPQGPVWHIFEEPWLPPGWRQRGKPPWDE